MLDVGSCAYGQIAAGFFQTLGARYEMILMDCHSTQRQCNYFWRQVTATPAKGLCMPMQRDTEAAAQ